MYPEDTTVTQAVLAAAAAEGDKPAVVDEGGSVLAYSGLAAAGQAASGLMSRGVRRGDVAAVHVARAGELALAVHTLCAAGAVPLLLPPDATVADLAASLAARRARVLVTTSALAATALEAVERSFVRQVVGFGAAPGVTPFETLLGSGPPIPPDRRGRSGGSDLALLICGGPGGAHAAITNAERVEAARRLAADSRVSSADVVVVSWPTRPHQAHTCVIDLVLSLGATAVTVSEPGPDAFLRAVRAYGGTAVATAAPELRAVVSAGSDLAAVRATIAIGPVPADLERACARRLGRPLAAAR